MKPKKQTRSYLLLLSLGALGVVYGDIGTSPLYALRECFFGPHAIAVTFNNVLGVLSLIFWTLISIVSIKYLGFVLRADNRGEGGILSLLSLAFSDLDSKQKFERVMIAMGLFGTALLYGDGMITPAISVLSAVEGLKVATPIFEPFVIPITVFIIVALFWVQRHGTGKIGKVFGGMTLIWFIVLALLGVRGILLAPEVLKAINPVYALDFFHENGWKGFVVLGAVFLVVTGAEALYADLGHFGKKPIRLAWFAVVLPALMLNYFGQGGLLLSNPAAAENPFYRLAPGWSLYPLVILATVAAVIASQALISGVFSLSMQAIQLGYFPRLKIAHTSSLERGQIYLPHVNWALMLACVGLVIGFGSSSNLAAAYGIAVTMTMLITTILFFFAAQRLWGWSPWKTGLICLPFLGIEVAFFGANVLKITHGGWFPILAGLAVFTLLTTWKKGRQILGDRLRAATLPFELFLKDVRANPPVRVTGTAIYLSGRGGVAPLALLHNLKHNKVLHGRIVFLTIVAHDSPFFDDKDRLELEDLKDGFFRIVGNYGFMEEPDIPRLMEMCAEKGLKIVSQETTYFLSKETLIPASKRRMTLGREKLFTLMSRNAVSPASFFKLPPNRVVELGMQVEL